MGYSQRDLANKFAEGATTGSASNMKIREYDDGWTGLVGYGHALYAARSPNGRTYLFRGWAMRSARRNSGSASTKSQISKIGSIADVDIAYEKASTRGERSTKERSDIVTSVEAVAAPKAARFNPTKILEADPEVITA